MTDQKVDDPRVWQKARLIATIADVTVRLLDLMFRR